MCGIIGYTGRRSAGPIIVEGLRHLEYRGYDSAGIVLLDRQRDLYVMHAVGKVDALVQRLEGTLPLANCGLGHTRWATHGEPCERNAHPQLDPGGQIAVVHNGIIENFEDLRRKHGRGAFSSETDTEVLAHMLAGCSERGMDLLDALREVVGEATGAYSLVAVSRDEPERIVAARVGNAGGIVIGIGDGEHLLASDLGALLPHTRRVTFLESGEFADLYPDHVSYVDIEGRPLLKTVEVLPDDAVAAVKGPYRHFMLKEIFEQPEVVLGAIQGRYLTGPARVVLDGLGMDEEAARSLRRIVLVGMGTSMHAAMIGRHYLEQFAGIPAEVDNSAEFRYRAPVLDEHTMVVSITQSGETADTLAAMEEAKRAGARLIALCNTPGTQATRMADGTILLRAGPEIAVASTKTFVASVLMLHALGLHLGRLRGVLDPEVEQRQVEAVLRLPDALRAALEGSPQVMEIAKRYVRHENFFFLGRALGYPLALEGALKLKEIAYVHAEGYAAGEMKHGPIALIDDRMPTFAIAMRDGVQDKMRSNVEQIRARHGRVIALVSEGDESLRGVADDLIEVPDVDPMLMPVLAAVPLQLFPYFIATLRGADVDQPRNLAKTVTVE